MTKKHEAHLKPVARGSELFPDPWLEKRSDLLSAIHFRRKPGNVRSGHHLVLYASRHEPGEPADKQKLFAVVRATRHGDDCSETSGEFPWRLSVQPLMVFPRLKFAPTLSESGIAPNKVKEADVFWLEDAEYEAFLEAVKSRLR
ncbi:MAG: hypothetical protein H0U16_01320 [Actinobacteria bacterium]|nr:hypothetical protein [Actinomycetota bacterium]